MSNYYEILNVPTTASTAEIQTAYEQQYNQWRRLVTHHDPNVVNQANQALQALETIRTTLTDATKRAGYDAGIGLGSVSGLADPEAILKMSPPRPATSPSPKTSSAPVPGSQGLWTCPKCTTDNPEHTQYCLKCGTQLVRECPKCRSVASLVSTGFCGECGTNYDSFTKRAELVRQHDELLKTRDVIAKELESLQATSEQAQRVDYSGVMFVLVLSFFSMLGGVSIGFTAIQRSNLDMCGPGSLLILLGGIGFLLGFWGLIRKYSTHRTNESPWSAEIDAKQKQLSHLDRQSAMLDEQISRLR
jgi:YD repeat-containing protein